MSSYLANLARRSIGMVPTAHPRVGPGGGLDARLVRARAEPAAPRPSDRIAPSFPDQDHAEDARRSGAASGGHAAADVTSATGEPVAPMPDEPRRLRLVEPSPRPQSRDDPREPSPPAARPATGRAASSVEIRPALAGREPDGPRDLVSAGREAPENAAGSGADSNVTVRPRVTVVGAALSPAHFAGARAVTEMRDRGRDVDVRIGTIEIHAEPTSPVPVPPAPLAMPAVGRPLGGFDDFVRLRTYAPWER